MLSPRRNTLRQPMFSKLIEEFLTPTTFKTSYSAQPCVFDAIQQLDEEKDVMTTYMFVPGVTSDQVDVSVNAQAHVINIVVKVEFETDSNEFLHQVYSNRMQKSFRMTSDYDVEQTTVDLSNGILTLTTPRMSKSPQSVKLPINTTQIEEKK